MGENGSPLPAFPAYRVVSFVVVVSLIVSLQGPFSFLLSSWASLST